MVGRTPSTECVTVSVGFGRKGSQMNRTYVAKLVRKANRLAEVAKDEKALPSARRQATAKQNLVETEILGLLFDPHEAKNAEIDAQRARQLLGRKSTTVANRARRLLKTQDAERRAQELALDNHTGKQRAQDQLEMLMGRKSVEDFMAGAQADAQAADR